MKDTAADSAAAVDVLARWVKSPLAFVRECLGVEPDAWQRDVLEAAGAGHQRIAMKACKGPGKSAVEAWLILWFLATRPHCKVACTSITEDNLRDCLWAECAKWMAASPFLTSAFTWTASRIVCNEHPDTWWASARTWPKTADATRQADTLAGIHADHVLFVLDESGGIPSAVMATAEAGLANADAAAGRTALLVQAGNPTDVEGPLYDAFTKDRHLWWTCEITGDPDDPKRSPRVSVEWAREQIAKWGRDNPWVLVNVFGRFPPTASDKLLGVEEVRAAMTREVAPLEYLQEARIMGVDVARFGDDRSVICFRQGNVVFRPKVFRNLDLDRLASEVGQSITSWKPHAVFVDGTGVGAGVVDRLRKLGHRIVEVNFGGKPSEPRFSLKRDEMWWKASRWVKGSGSLPDDTELLQELIAPRFDFTPADSKLTLESKKELKERGLPSPDKADAFVLTFADPVPAPMRVTDGNTWFDVGARPATAVHEYDPFLPTR